MVPARRATSSGARLPAAEGRLAVAAFVVVAALALALAPAAARGLELFHADFEQRFFGEPRRLVTDHTIIQDGSGLYHIFYTIAISGQGWPQRGNAIDFGHATSNDLIHWTVEPRVLAIRVGTWKDRNLWAPHVVPAPGGGYLMTYTGVDSNLVQSTGAASSPYLFAWTDLSVTEPAYHPDPAWAQWQLGQWSDGRDPFVFPVGNRLALISTALADDEYTGSGDRGAVSYAFSDDGVHFTDVGFPLFINNSVRTLESTSIHRRDNRYFLFFHESGYSGVRYMQSPGLVSGWDKSTTRILDPLAFAPSDVITTADNATLMSRVYDADLSGVIIYGAKIDSLEWSPAGVGLGSANTLWDQWSAISGDAFDHQPTFGDRPLTRGAQPSGLQGFFWINTAETYTGPIDNNDPDAVPEVARTGVLRSASFTVTGGHMRFLVAGGNDIERLYLALVETSSGIVYRRTTGSGSNVLVRQTWNLAGLQGANCYIMIVDERDSGPNGYIAVDDIEEVLGPPPIGVAAEPSPAWPALLGAAYPSPTRGPAAIPFSLERNGRVRLLVYDVAGRLRRRLLDQDLGAGAHHVLWDGRDAAGQPVAAGVYFLRLESDGATSSRSVAVVP